MDFDERMWRGVRDALLTGRHAALIEARRARLTYDRARSGEWMALSELLSDVYGRTALLTTVDMPIIDTTAPMTVPPARVSAWPAGPLS